MDKLELVTDRNFCEEDYLIANADVRAAVVSGDLTSGRQHFNQYGRKEDRKQRAPLVFFLHIPKTAGSMLHTKLAEHFPNGSAHCERWLYEDDNKQLLDTLCWITGHVPYTEANARVRQCTNRRVEYFTCVRNPTDQVRSHYNWLIEIYHRGKEWYEPHDDWVKLLSERIRNSGFSVPAIKKNLLDYSDFFLNCQTSFLLNMNEPVSNALSPIKFATTTDKLSLLLYEITGQKLNSNERVNESSNHFDPGLFYEPEMQSFLREHNARDEELFRLVTSRNSEASLTVSPRWIRWARALSFRAAVGN